MSKNWDYGKVDKYNTYTPYRYPVILTSPEERSFKSGFKQVLAVGTLDVAEVKQYNIENNEIVKMGIKRYGYFNGITVINQSDQDVRVDLDYSVNKSFLIPAGTQSSITDVLYDSFNIINVDGANITDANAVKVYLIYERPTTREMI
jgi:hypothetical protein